jgi:hypothetical protein
MNVAPDPHTKTFPQDSLKSMHRTTTRRKCNQPSRALHLGLLITCRRASTLGCLKTAHCINTPGTYMPSSWRMRRHASTLGCLKTLRRTFSLGYRQQTNNTCSPSTQRKLGHPMTRHRTSLPRQQQPPRQESHQPQSRVETRVPRHLGHIHGHLQQMVRSVSTAADQLQQARIRALYCHYHLTLRHRASMSFHPPNTRRNTLCMNTCITAMR